MSNWLRAFWQATTTEIGTTLSFLGLILAIIVVPSLWLRLLFGVPTVYCFYRLVHSFHVLQSDKHQPLFVIAFPGATEQRRGLIDNIIRVMEGYGFREKEFRTFGIDRDDWVIDRHTDMLYNPNDWPDVVNEFKNAIDRLGTKLQGSEFFHLFFRCRTALVFGLGAITGTWHNVVIYQQEGPTFNPVIRLGAKTEPGWHSLHAIKTRVNVPYKFIEVKENSDPLTNTTLVSLTLAAHSPEFFVMQEAMRRKLSCILVNNKYNGTLKAEDWFQPANEIASLLLELLTKCKELEVYHSCPTALAFAIGMALGDQAPVTIFHWFDEQKTYKPVLKLNELRRLSQ
jgi:hypothetical protein